MKEEILVKPESLQSLIEAELPEEPCWIYPGILPKGGTLLFGGGAKIGKSFIMLELQRALSTGTQPFGCHKLTVGDPCKTLLIEQELGKYGLQKRVKSIFAEERKDVYGKNAYYVSKVPEMQLDDRDGREMLMKLVEDVKPDILFLDPIGRMNSYDENKSDQIQQLFSHLDYVLKCFEGSGMSLVVSHHFNKPSNDPQSKRDPLDAYNFRGSSKWFDCPDSLITVNRLKNLDTKWKSWEVQVRYQLRQDEGLNDMVFSVNRENDLRVRYERTLGDEIKPMKKKEDEDLNKVMPKKQLKFAQG